ncbi:hypothetical protein CDO73_22585 [Saccharibacillus sp. O23]|uniref:hypothetical protein n=1 Tax=Saccharibacillus sp. O23 TaxID=2009338 RepID=UPI000B4E42D0|nr:hypothetical protein [Saccharibacillus sp. O23]OWR27408.1 hypothetical protein CDO73_22585 [Saccharibacillus sp. O23]
MKKRKKLRFLGSALLAASLVLPLSFVAPSAQAESSYSNQLLSRQVQSVPVSKTEVLFVDKFSGQLQLLDVSADKIVWTKKFAVLHDCEVLAGSGKIVVLTESGKKLQKQVLSLKGKPIGKQDFTNISGGSDLQVQWSAAGSGVKESIAVMNGDRVAVYQYPWKKPVHVRSAASEEDRKHENPGAESSQFQYPYFVAKMKGYGIMQSRDYYKIVNVSTGRMNLILFPSNVDTNFVTEGTSLVVNTSSMIGSPLGLSTFEPIVYARYDLKTAKSTASIKRTFTDRESNWATSYLGGRLLLTDTEKGKQSLLTPDDQIISERTADLKSLQDRLLGYTEGRAVVLVPFGKQSAKLASAFEK